ncbi:MAG TPA: helix-turn-helix transcriptional regulator [Solirubrobacteraceae bacterium]|jgi:DNA-binding PadR family transcriptional regulator|nr:helix-turn-helix transcriptional regulator [Solirubrobacteraceae bacterium]
MASTELQGHLDAMLLAILDAGPLHGYAIVEEIARRSDGEFDLPEGTIYPALHRLEAAGLLSSRWEVVSGRRRRVYALSHSGLDAVRERVAGWRAFRAAVDAVLAPVASPGQT